MTDRTLDQAMGMDIAAELRERVRHLGSDAARAVGRFNHDGPTGYRAATAPGAPIRATRVEAEVDEAAWLSRKHPS